MKRLSILIYHKGPFNPLNGGIERVSVSLGNWFLKQGYNVYFLTEDTTASSNKENLFSLPIAGGLTIEENIIFFKDFINVRLIDIIINQDGIFPSSLPLIDLKGTVPLITVMHNTLFGMFEHPNFPHISSRIIRRVLDTRPFRRLFRSLFWLKYHRFYYSIVRHSDRVVLLSDSFKEELRYYSGCRDFNNVISILNPLTIDRNNVRYTKEKEIVFVGRLEYQKRPDLMLDVWKIVYPKHRDWHLKILGDGMDRAKLQRRINDEKIQNVSMEGFVSPIEYYKKASILCMTSCYETFGLVLVEAMNYGVIPIAFNSYPTLGDIITDRKDGFVVSPFDVVKYAEILDELMDNEYMRRDISENAYSKLTKFDICDIGKRWIALFDDLVTTRIS